MKYSILNFKFQNRGFTLIEMIIYIAIVAMILTSISYLIIDIIGGQTINYTDQEVNYNLRLIANNLTRDIKQAQDIGSITADTLVLIMPVDNIIYNFDNTAKIITRQIGSSVPVDIGSNKVEVVGSFSDLSRFYRSKNIGVNLAISYKNPDNLSNYNASTTIDFAVELRGKK